MKAKFKLLDAVMYKDVQMTVIGMSVKNVHDRETFMEKPQPLKEQKTEHKPGKKKGQPVKGPVNQINQDRPILKAAVGYFLQEPKNDKEGNPVYDLNLAQWVRETDLHK